MSTFRLSAWIKFTVSDHSGEGRHHCLQSFGRPLGCVLLGESDPGVQKNDAEDATCKFEICGVARARQQVGEKRDHRSHHQHNREHVRELRGEFGHSRSMMCRGEFVRPGLCSALQRLAGRKALRGTPKGLIDVGSRQCLNRWRLDGSRSRPRGRLGWGNRHRSILHLRAAFGDSHRLSGLLIRSARRDTNP